MGEPSLREWLDGAGAGPESDDEPGTASPAGGRSSRRLWALAALAWAVVAGVVVALARAPEPAPAGGPDAGAPAATGPRDVATGVRTAAPTPAAADAGAPAVEVTGDGGAGLDAAAAAVAVIAVRLAGTAPEPDGRARYVDLAVPSNIDWHGDVAVVTVDAVVLDGAADGWQPPRLARFAQAVLADPGAPPRPLGRPWVLPAPPAEGEPPVLEPLDDPDASSEAASRLAEAGYTGVEIAGLARLTHAPGLVVVTATARAPGEERQDTHHVWLAEGPAGAVLGLHDPGTGGTSPPGQEEP